ncbi:hypothetical protein C8R45DRAFT_947547 [Mycena sanguinolenta]|nr:hypothetical protein C8R45DRAFT_947547 [Mycena sanguinolenta]
MSSTSVHTVIRIDWRSGGLTIGSSGNPHWHTRFISLLYSQIPMVSHSDGSSLAEDPLPCHISSIPPEILSQIMLMCDRDLTIWNATRQMQLAGHDIPVWLTQICSSWRMLALDTRELWSSVTLVLNEKLVQSNSAITKLAKLADYWLAKGKRGGLALKIDVGVIRDSENPIYLEPIGRLLTAWASDWRNLTIAHCPDRVAEYVAAKMAQSTYPSLEEFELHAFSTVWHTRFEALAALPRLRTVSFLTWCIPSIYHNLILPWSQLESLSISAPVSGREYLDILANCSELTKLDAYVISDIRTSELRPPVVLPKLSRLRLGADVTSWGSWDYSTRDFESFLGMLHLPMLLDLNLHFIGRDLWNPLVSPFWERHAAKLHSLELFNLYFLADVRLLFLTLPNVMSLTLGPREIRLTAPDFDALRAEHLLPALTRLDIAVGYERGVQLIDSVRPVIALLEARITPTTGVARLGHVILADCTDWDEVDKDLSKADPEAMAVELQRLRALKAQGMDVHWMVRGHDMLASRDTSIRYASPAPLSTYFDSDSDSTPATPPTTSPMKPKRTALRRLWQRMKNIRLGSV